MNEILDLQVELAREYAGTQTCWPSASPLSPAPRWARWAQTPTAGHGTAYSLGRHTAQALSRGLEKVRDGTIGDHRQAVTVADDVAPVTEDVLIGRTVEVE